jgi:hypothetical protein
MIPHLDRVRLAVAIAVIAMVTVAGRMAPAQVHDHRPNDLPNPYGPGVKFGQLPDGRTWGSTAGISVGPDGNIWTYDRCGGSSCAGSDLAPLLEFDASGKLLKSFGTGMFVQPHGIFADKDGNVWVTDDLGKDGKGHQVIKFSPDGKVLMALGKAGVAGDGPDAFNQPSAVIVAPNGDIFVADGHDPLYANSRIVKFSKDGKFIKAWGKFGSAPGEFKGAHTLAFDSQGRLFVGDRTNNRLQIFDQDGNFIAEWKQFGRPSGVFIDRDDTIYVADSESTDDPHQPLTGQEEGYGYNPGFRRGIRIGSAKTGKVVAFIPDPDPKGISSAAEGVAVDRNGNIYGAEVGPKDVKKYVKK